MAQSWSANPYFPTHKIVPPPNECEPTAEEFVDHVTKVLKGKRMSVRAKFRCHFKDDQNGVVKLSPVVDGSEENKEFFSYTPGGEISLYLGLKAGAAFAQFEQGREYYVDFTPAPCE